MYIKCVVAAVNVYRYLQDRYYIIYRGFTVKTGYTEKFKSLRMHKEVKNGMLLGFTIQQSSLASRKHNSKVYVYGS